METSQRIPQEHLSRKQQRLRGERTTKMGAILDCLACGLADTLYACLTEQNQTPRSFVVSLKPTELSGDGLEHFPGIARQPTDPTLLRITALPWVQDLTTIQRIL